MHFPFFPKTLHRYRLLWLVGGFFLLASCEKENEVNSPQSEIPKDVLSRISKNWSLRFYTIRTDAGDHRFEKNELTRHSLRTINIARNNRYTAFEPTWSGTFSMPQDSAAIAFFPEALNRMPFDLSITRLVWQECVLETRDIPVNPVGSNATPYDVFVADQAFKFLVSRNIDVNSLKRVGIRFTYIN